MGAWRLYLASATVFAITDSSHDLLKTVSPTRSIIFSSCVPCSGPVEASGGGEGFLYAIDGRYLEYNNKFESALFEVHDEVEKC